MTQRIFDRIGQMFVIAAIQVLVLDHLHLWGYATPMIGSLFVVFAPWGAGRIGEMLMAFILGVVMDMFTMTPGVAAGSMVLTSFVQFYLLKTIVARDSDPEDGMAVNARNLGGWKFFMYLFMLVMLQQTVYFALEFFSFADGMDLFISYVGSLALSVVVALMVAVLYGRFKA